jgi:hypothetical protein
VRRGYAVIAGISAMAMMIHFQPTPLPHLFSMIFIFLGLLLFFTYLDLGRKRSLFSLGICLGLSIMSKQSLGVFAFIAFFLLVATYLMWSEKQAKAWIGKLVVLSAGTSLTVLPFVYFIFQTSIHLVVRSVLLPVSGLVQYSSLPFPKLASIIPASLTGAAITTSITNVIIWSIPLITMLGGLYLLFIYTRYGLIKTFWCLLALIVVNGFVFLQVYPRCDFNHAYYNMPIVVILVLYLATGIESVLAARTALVFTVFKVLITASIAMLLLWQISICYLWIYLKQAVGMKTPPAVVVRTERACLIVHDTDLAKVVEYIACHTKSHDYILAIPDNTSIIYFLTGTCNATVYDEMLPGQLSEQDEESAVNDLRRHNVSYIVFNDMGPKGYDRKNLFFEGYGSMIYNYIEGHYRVIEEYGPYRIYGQRRPEGNRLSKEPG